MKLDQTVTQRLPEEYEETQPLAASEAEHLEMLSSAFATGDFGWRDAEWVVQWFYRRFLGTYPDKTRRELEDDYGENSYEAVREAVTGSASATATETKLNLLTELTGVGVSVASAFLQFLDPESYVVMSSREWGVLRRTGELPEPYPDNPGTQDYERYVSACRTVAERCHCDLWTVYQALWLVWSDDAE